MNTIIKHDTHCHQTCNNSSIPNILFSHQAKILVNWIVDHAILNEVAFSNNAIITFCHHIDIDNFSFRISFKYDIILYLLDQKVYRSCVPFTRYYLILTQ